MILRKICRILFVLIIAIMIGKLAIWFSDIGSNRSTLIQFGMIDWLMLVNSSFIATYETSPFLVYAFLISASIRAVM